MERKINFKKLERKIYLKIGNIIQLKIRKKIHKENGN